MAEEHVSLTEQASSHVFKHFTKHLGKDYSFHNFAHTAEVVEAVVEIGEASGLQGQDLEVVVLAAWFHDTGITEVYTHHEQASADFAERFLKKRQYDRDAIAAVRNCILVTELDVAPTTLQEKVICDADLLHIGRKRFWSRAQLLRQELAAVAKQEFSEEEWLRKQVTFLEGRTFYTDYARAEYQDRLDKNLATVKTGLAAVERGEDVDFASLAPKGKKKKKDKQSGSNQAAGVKEILGKGDRGVETMFRITSRNHVSFSSMVDSKANIMISINALVISVIISVLFRKLDTNPYMAVPTFLFLAVCLTTIVYAVLASRPKVTSGMFTREDIEQKRANLLFFGNFYNVPVDDFEWGMREMLKDKDYLYGSMIRDFYYLGQVLGRKYHHLRVSYNVFMYGFVVSILLYVVMFLLFADQPIDLLPLGTG
ncbi:HD domain-containing protein [bacterium]|nr:HD domain-containing protein [bacterium]